MRIKSPHWDIGLIWAKVQNIWGQVGVIASIVNFIMMLVVFYTTSVHPNVKISIWLYGLIIVIGAALVIWFIVKWGISGYYRFFSQQSEMNEISRKVGLIMKKLNIDDKNK